MAMAPSCRSLLPLAASLALLYTGCDTTGPPRPVLIASTPWVGNTPLNAARDLGLYGDADVRIIDVSTDFDAWRALREKRATMSTGTLTDMIRSHDHGVNEVAVLALDYSRGADGIVAREGIEKIEDLKGKRIAVERSTLTHFVLIRALEKANMREDEVILENLATDEGLEALNKGNVDAAALWEPLLTAAQKNGHKLVFTSKEMPGEILDVLSVRADFLQTNPREVDIVIRAYLDAVDRFEADPQYAEKTVARLMGIPEAEAKSSLGTVALLGRAQNRDLFNRAAPQNIWHAYQLNVQFMERHQMLRHGAPAAETLIDPTPAQRVLAERR